MYWSKDHCLQRAILFFISSSSALIINRVMDKWVIVNHPTDMLIRDSFIADFRTRFKMLWEKIDSLPRTDTESDENNRKKLKDNLVTVMRIAEETKLIENATQRENRISELKYETTRAHLSIINIAETHRSSTCDEKLPVERGFMEISLDEMKLTETLSNHLKELDKKQCHVS